MSRVAIEQFLHLLAAAFEDNREPSLLANLKSGRSAHGTFGGQGCGARRGG